MIDEITLGYERLRQPKTLSCLVGDINPTLGNLTARVQQLDDAVKQRLRAPAPGKKAHFRLFDFRSARTVSLGLMINFAVRVFLNLNLLDSMQPARESDLIAEGLTETIRGQNGEQNLSRSSRR